MQYDRSAQAALLKWVNTFPLEISAESLEELTDGHVLGQVLKDMDPQFDSSEMDSNTGPSSWLNKKRNLQVVCRGLARFIHRTHPEMDALAKFHSLADRADAASVTLVSHCQRSLDLYNEVMLKTGSIQVLSVMLAIALLASPENTKYIPVTQQLDPHTLKAIQEIIVEKQELLKKADLNDTIDQALQHTDADLVLEERIAHYQAEIMNLKKKLADANTRLEHVKVNYDELIDENQRHQTELEAMRKLQLEGKSDSHAIRALESKIQEQDDLIANQEAQAEDDRVTKSRLTREVDALRQKSQKADDLEAEVRKLSRENETLEKQAKWAERYAQKLERQKEIETENQNLQYEKEQLQENLTDYERLKVQVKQHEATQKRYQDRLQAYEVEVVDIERQKKLLDEMIASLRHEVALLQARSAADENLINDLNEQLKSGVIVDAAGSPSAGQTVFSLEQELNDAKETGPPNHLLEISRLKAENALLKSTVGSGGDNARLRMELEEERSQHMKVQGNFNDMFEKHAVAQDQIGALLDNMTDDRLVRGIDAALLYVELQILTSDYYRSEVIANLRKQLLQANEELKSERERTSELEMQAADRDRDLLAAKTDLSAMEMDSVDALDALKATDKLIAASLKEELDRVRAEKKSLATEIEKQKSHLIDALLTKDKLSKELDESKALQEKVPNQSLSNEEVSEAVKKTNDKIDKMRARLKQRQEVRENAKVLSSHPNSVRPMFPAHDRAPRLDTLSIAAVGMVLPRPPRRARIRPPPRARKLQVFSSEGSCDWAPGKKPARFNGVFSWFARRTRRLSFL
jgi:protein HOOK3